MDKANSKSNHTTRHEDLAHLARKRDNGTLGREGDREWQPKLTSVGDALEDLVATWEKPDVVVSTGLRQLDRSMFGGMRSGQMIGVVAPAGGGKSVLVGQIALDAAKAGALVIYASVEMPPTEIAARWLARESFLLAGPGMRPLSHGEIYYGHVWRGMQDEAFDRMERARQLLAQLRANLYPQQILPGSTVAGLQRLVDAARHRAARQSVDVGKYPVVLIVDPLQRLYASESGGLTGRALQAVNASETERVGAVAQQLKQFADDEKITVLFTSDTTKSAADRPSSNAVSFRGSYQINHLATMTLGLHTAGTSTELAKRLGGKSEDGEAIVTGITEEAIRENAPTHLLDRKDARALGAKVAVLDCGKSRTGAPRYSSFLLVPGDTRSVSLVERTMEDHGTD